MQAWMTHPVVDQAQNGRFEHAQKPCKNREILHTFTGMSSWDLNPKLTGMKMADFNIKSYSGGNGEHQ
jgi:hypothetical protein